MGLFEFLQKRNVLRVVSPEFGGFPNPPLNPHASLAMVSASHVAVALLLLAMAAGPSMALNGPGFSLVSHLRLRGGGMEALAGDAYREGRGREQTEKDPAKRRELFNSVPRMNHKEEWQKWKTERFPKKSRGPIWRELRDFACGSVVTVL